MTPYESYMTKAAFLPALIGGGLRLAGSVAAMPFMGQMAGGALRFLGAKGLRAGIPGSKSVFQAGAQIRGASNKILGSYNNWLNQGRSFGTTDMSKVPLLGKIPLGMLNVDTTPGVKGMSQVMRWTPRRITHTGIAGTGSVLGISDMFKSDTPHGTGG